MLTRLSRTPGHAALLAGLACFGVVVAACGGSGHGNPSTPRPPAAGNLSGAPTATTPSTTTAGSAVTFAQVGSLGTVLTDARDMTLYIFTPDTAGASTCAADCAATWPPLASTTASPAKPDGLAGDLSVTKRDDGSLQVVYNGQPLYGFAGDKVPGDTNGQGIGGVWFVASVSSGATSDPSSPTPTPTAPSASPAAATTIPTQAPAEVATATQAAPASTPTPTPIPSTSIPGPVATPTPVPPTAAPPIATPSTPVVTTPTAPSPTPTVYTYPY